MKITVTRRIESGGLVVEHRAEGEVLDEYQEIVDPDHGRNIQACQLAADLFASLPSHPAVAFPVLES